MSFRAEDLVIHADVIEHAECSLGRPTRILALVLVLAIAPTPVTGDPPPPEEVRVPMGGAVLRTDTRWVAPFVEYTEVRGDRWESHKVRWFSEKGEVLAEVDRCAPSTSFFDYYFVSDRPGGVTFHGMYNDWKIPSSGAGRHGVASADGRIFVTFVRDFPHDEPRPIPPTPGPALGANVHLQGKLAVKLGPFRGMTLANAPVEVGADGSVAALFSTTASPERGRVLVTDTNGRITMTFSTRDTELVQAAPDGRGALLWQANGALFYAPANDTTRRVSMDSDLPPHAQAMGWVPESALVLIAGSDTRQVVLLDCDRGRVVWRATSLGSYHVVAFDRYVFETGLAPASDVDPALMVRAINVLDIKTGNLVATWRSTTTARYTQRDIGRLMIRDHRLYYVTDEIFGEILPEQVAKGESCACTGWESVSGLHPSLRK